MWFKDRLVESRNITRYKSKSTSHFPYSYSSEDKWKCQRITFGVYFTTSKRAFQQLHQVAEYVKHLGIVLLMNVLQGIGFKNSGREICPSVVNHSVNDHTPWMTKPCRRPLRRTVVNLQTNLTFLMKQLDFICTF
ncbi:hypothetical protein NPIL_693821 [Nephila pilipes]|uniref:Uncharacterized protein n=1 Tax=Nephila pilipes TaxID=299642 RepID=A0A8X6MN56_NEPPI|nr:hypothetical protein NPIL_693821 [Nephila pilipes]